MRVACATDDGKTFVTRHFGDADKYLVYELNNDKFNLVDTITNTTDEEEQHADPKKAKGIAGLLAEKKIDVGVTKVFGPNIKRIKKHFVPVLVGVDTIEEGLQKILSAVDEVQALVELGANREHLDLREK